jgi:hypothetical protein
MKNSIKKKYIKPALKKYGKVKDFTMKIGSGMDAGLPGNFSE